MGRGGMRGLISVLSLQDRLDIWCLPRVRADRVRGTIAALVLAAFTCLASPASGFGVAGAIVDLTPGADGGEMNLTQQTSHLDAARTPQDPTATLVTLMSRIPTMANRRAAYAWIVATSRRPRIEAPAALYALIRSGLQDPALVFQAATFAQSKGANGYDLYRWAEAAGLQDPARKQLAALADNGTASRQESWRINKWTAPAPAAAGGG